VKKLLLFSALFLFGASLAACGGVADVEIALITDYGDIDDESFNQGTWEGIVEYAEEHGIAYDYYRPSEVSDDAYIEEIDRAVRDGAKIIVTPGFLFSQAVYTAQLRHPHVTFILLDAVPEDEDEGVFVAHNTVSIFYDEHESGFLAGYAAVYDGFTDLGYMGGIAVPAVVRFGIGFIAGAYYAADELGITINFPDNRYTYLGTFNAGPAVESEAAGWFNAGTEIIFAAAGGAGGSVMSAAEDLDKWMIGVDVDQSVNSDRVLTSAMKALATSVQLVLDNYYNGRFPAGQILQLGAENDGVGLPMETSRFRNPTEVQAAYDEIFEMIAEGDIVVPSNYDELLDFFTEEGLGELPIERGTVGG